VLEKVGRNATPVELVTNQQWDAEVHAAEKEMTSSWLERGLVPLRRSVSDFAVHQIRTLARAREVAASLSAPKTVAGSQPGTGCELWVESRSGLVAGAIDYAFYDDGVVVRDYKSGCIYDIPTISGSIELKRDYVVQMEMYAALYNATFRVWPKRLEIMPASGAPVVVRVDEAVCETRVRAGEALLEAVNESIDHVLGRAPDDFSSLATPSPDSCSACSFRPHCSAYTKSKPDSDQGWPVDLSAVVTKVQQLGNGSLALLVTDSSGALHSIKGLTPGERHPALSIVQAGAQVSVFNLVRAYPAKDLREGPYTTIYVTGIAGTPA
jgi:hypothetical protein